MEVKQLDHSLTPYLVTAQAQSAGAAAAGSKGSAAPAILHPSACRSNLQAEAVQLETTTYVRSDTS